MSLKAVVTDIATVTEELRDFYVEREGLFVLDVEPVEINGQRWGNENVGSIKSALQSERTERERLDRIVKSYGDLTPALAREAHEKAERFSKLDPEKDAERIAGEKIKAAEQQYLDKLEREKEPLLSKLALREKQLERKGKVEAIKQALLANQAVPEDLDYLAYQADRYVRMIEKDDEFLPEVIDDKGSPRISLKPGSTAPMAIDELISTVIRPKFGRHFIGENASGSGSSVNGSTAPNTSGGATRRIPLGDQNAINRNIADLASGKATVAP